MRPKWEHSIRGKLTGVIMLTSVIVVLVACAGSILQDAIDEKEELNMQIVSYGRLIGASSDAPLAFGDATAAAEALSVLRTKASFVAGGIYTDSGLAFAKYSDGTVAVPPRIPRRASGIARGPALVTLFLPIIRDGQRVGTVYIASDRRDFHARMREDAWATAVILLVCLIVAYILSSRLQSRISGPIVELARLTVEVSQRKDFTLRATPRASHAGDEIGSLVTGFNGMLAEIEERDDALLRHRTRLEDTVALRTGELTTANEELLLSRDTAEKSAEINARLARESALILNSATDGILGIGLDGRAKFINPAGERMFGMTLSDMEGKSIHDAVHHSHPDGTPWAETDCASTHAIVAGETLGPGLDTFWRKDGTSFPVEYSSTPMFDDAGNQQGAVVMFRDVTERRAVERLKSEFVSTVSHELRTPLTSIRGALGLLSSGLLGPIADKGQRMLEIAVNNTDRLVRLINDILDLERIESGKVELVRSVVDANTLMVQALEGVQSIADEAGVRLVRAPATEAVWGDSDRIIQTLTNLLGNAIKFSPPDTTVRLSGARRNADFTFCVADQGRGVPEDKLESIFERFSQVDASDSRDKGGSGLGLAICHSIVTAHGGRIWAEKNDPAGTRFLFTIPLAVPAVVKDPIESLPSKTILVFQAETSPNVTEILERGGFRVVTAASPAELIALAAGDQPDAIVLGMSDSGHGRQIVEVLKSTVETRLVPIVVVTGQPPESYEKYADTVANWVSMPLQSDSLILAIDLAVRTPSILVVEDDLDLAGVMTAALRNHGIRTLHAATGSEAVEMCRQHHPSLIVLDLILPDMDGFAVVDSLRKSATLGRVPLLVYSALDVGIADQSRLRLGQTEFLTKSRCSPADFEARVIRLLETVTDKPKEGKTAA